MPHTDEFSRRQRPKRQILGGLQWVLCFDLPNLVASSGYTKHPFDYVIKEMKLFFQITNENHLLVQNGLK